MDLHLHSIASDGRSTPEDVVLAAAAVGVGTIALTDHDTLGGVAAAQLEGTRSGVRVIAGCEFSVRVWWGELHLLGYFLPPHHEELDRFLLDQRTNRDDRARAIIEILRDLGAPVTYERVYEIAGGAPIGRPHIARALVEAGRVRTVGEAFDRFLADGGPAYAQRPLPELDATVALVRRLGGVTSAAHLKDRGTAANVERLAARGVDAIEVLHPAHDHDTESALRKYVARFDLLMTGGSDWHGVRGRAGYREIGCSDVPDEWVDSLEGLHRRRLA